MKTQKLRPARERRRTAYAAVSRDRNLCALGQADFAGKAVSVGAARAWADGLLAGHVADEVREDAVLLLSELVTNSIVHSDSGRKAGGLVTVFLAAGDGVAHCEVIDDGSAASVPVIREACPEDGSGRGLWMVNVMADAWGVHHDDEAGNAVWFRIGGQPMSTHLVPLSSPCAGGAA
ncbi:ATP-binding protein [Microtetraspora niveoalba]|uniref:ATP-binding protein n=1 Tax=Microtetraspora niveoalba TaxID=46175 RepID=UPI000A03B0C4|nr:ATP-binding protein [Microtetraspora niveoalba]